MVDDLLELSRLENVLPRDLEPLRPGQSRQPGGKVPGAVCDPWQSRVTFGLRLLGNPDGTLTGDRPRLHRALLNLLDNAIRYSPQAKSIDVIAMPSGAWWSISVRDRGPGLSYHDMTHLLKRFYRGDPSRSRSGGGRNSRVGSGPGLAIVNQIAVAHGGRVQARNHPGGGAVLELVLPKGA